MNDITIKFIIDKFNYEIFNFLDIVWEFLNMNKDFNI